MNLFKWLKKQLTWVTVEQVCELKSLKWYQKLFKKLLEK